MIAPHSVTMIAGGPHVQALRTAAHLPEHGVEVFWFNPWEKYADDEFDLYHLFGASMITHDIALRLRQYSRPFVVSSIFYTMRSPAFVRMARGVETLSKRFYKGIWTDYGVTSDVCREAEMVLPNTASEAAIVREGFEIPSTRIRVVPNGVDARFANADPALFERAYGLHNFVLSVGHIGSTRKNVLSLIRALARIDVPAVIVGQIQQSGYAQQCIAEAARNPRITIIEGLAHDSEMLASAYAASSLFALPSLFETPGIAALEAGLAGSRVAITRYGGTAEYFGEHAEYCDPLSVASITNAIERGLNRPRTDALREHIRREFLWEHVAHRTAAAYRDALAMRSAREQV